MFNHHPSNLGLRVRVDNIDLAQLVPRDNESNLKLLEICQDAANDGGITPSKGLVKNLHSHIDDLSMIVMIRPRTGDFTYTDQEFSLMLQQIAYYKTYDSVEGFTFAVLNKESEIDVARMVTLIKAAESKKLLFMGIALQFMKDDSQICEAMHTLNEIAANYGTEIEIVVNCDALNIDLRRFESDHRVSLQENAYELCCTIPEELGQPLTSLRFQQVISMDFTCTELQSILIVPITDEELKVSRCNCAESETRLKTEASTLVKRNISRVYDAATEVFVQCWTSGIGMGGSIDRLILQAHQKLTYP